MSSTKWLALLSLGMFKVLCLYFVGLDNQCIIVSSVGSTMIRLWCVDNNNRPSDTTWRWHHKCRPMRVLWFWFLGVSCGIHCPVAMAVYQLSTRLILGFSRSCRTLGQLAISLGSLVSIITYSGRRRHQWFVMTMWSLLDLNHLPRMTHEDIDDLAGW